MKQLKNLDANRSSVLDKDICCIVIDDKDRFLPQRLDYLCDPQDCQECIFFPDSINTPFDELHDIYVIQETHDKETTEH